MIVVADPSQSDSTTVILKSTTVIAYRPDMPERPFSCNLNNAEVFSCVLGSEEESALSIIDPVSLIVLHHKIIKIIEYSGDLKTV